MSYLLMIIFGCNNDIVYAASQSIGCLRICLLYMSLMINVIFNIYYSVYEIILYTHSFRYMACASKDDSQFFTSLGHHSRFFRFMFHAFISTCLLVWRCVPRRLQNFAPCYIFFRLPNGVR